MRLDNRNKSHWSRANKKKQQQQLHRRSKIDILTTNHILIAYEYLSSIVIISYN